MCETTHAEANLCGRASICVGRCRIWVRLWGDCETSWGEGEGLGFEVCYNHEGGRNSSLFGIVCQRHKSGSGHRVLCLVCWPCEVWMQSLLIALNEPNPSALLCLSTVSFTFLSSTPFFFPPRLLFLLGFLSLPRASFYPLPCLSPFSSRTLGAFPLYPSFSCSPFHCQSLTGVPSLLPCSISHTESSPQSSLFITHFPLPSLISPALFMCFWNPLFIFFPLFLPVLLCSHTHPWHTHTHILAHSVILLLSQN